MVGSLRQANVRQQFIGEQLRETGTIGRMPLMHKFGVSLSTSALDLKRYLHEHPSELEYDTSRKLYISLLPVKKTVEAEKEIDNLPTIIPIAQSATCDCHIHLARLRRHIEKAFAKCEKRMGKR